MMTMQTFSECIIGPGIGINYYTESFCDRDIYIDPVAGDDGGSGTAADPFKTQTHVASLIPRKLKHLYRVFIKAGTLTEWKYPTIELEDDGGLFWEAIDPPTVIESTLALTSQSYIGAYYEGLGFNVAGAGWTVDAYANKFIKMTSGTYTGCIVPIYRNTATSLITLGAYCYPSPGDTFDIVEPSTIVQVTTGLGWAAYDNNFIAGSPSNLAYTRTGIAGIHFKTSATTTTYGHFSFLGNAGLALAFTSFTATNDNTYVLNIGDLKKVNDYNLYNMSSFSNPYYNDWLATWMPTAATNNGVGVLYETVLLNNCSSIVGISTRGKVESLRGTSGASVTYSAIGQWRPYRHSESNLAYCYIDGIGGSWEGIRQYNGGGFVQWVWITNCSNAIHIDERGDMTIGDGVEVDTANCSGVALLCGPVPRVAIQPGLTVWGPPAGSGGQVQFSQGGGAPVAWPASNAAITDSQGGFIARD